ncbi:MAG: GNAT family N-acetyltransferase [Jiangellales bacterium]
MRIRQAEATVEDGRIYAGFADQAADGLFRWMLGPRFVEIVARAFVSRGHDQSFEYASFAEDDGAVVGMVSGFTGEQHARGDDSALISAAGWRAPRVVSTWMVAYPVLRFMDRVPAGDWYLQTVAVDPARRGQQIGSALLDHGEMLARASGSSRLVLDVVSTNDGAARLYERRGMVEEARSRSVPFGGGLSVRRMALVLER